MTIEAEVENLGDAEFRWGKKRGVGGKKKEVQFYDSFSYDDVKYALYDCVYMHKEDEAHPYIGKLVKIWQNPDKSKKVKIQWFFRPSEISIYLRKYDLEAEENELFFASGEGVGLANINPLEAIAGKCKVVCTSKDSRNPQPSEEQLQMADFVFYRTFDVGSCSISDVMGDKVGGLEVKFVFNRRESEIASGPKLVSSQKEGGDRIINTNSIVNAITNEVKDSGLQVKVEERANFEKGPLKSDDGEGARPSKRAKLDSGHKEFVGMAKDKRFAEGCITLDAKPSKKAKVEQCEDKVLNKVTTNPNSIDKVAPKEMHEKDKVNKSSIRSEDGPRSENCGGTIIKSPTLSKGLSDKKPNERMFKLKNRSLVTDKGRCIFEENLNKTVCKQASNNSAKVSEASVDLDNKIDGRIVEVTRRPDVEKGKWFMSLPWEARIQSAQEKRTLVLLQNLEPDYTSSEVEDIVWSAFKENCEAKVVQRTAFSSPHSGQALVIFKTKEVAEQVITKLSEGCLILPNQRPLVGCMAILPKITGKQSTFLGHLFIDKIKHQMQKETKDALSTSHCSQPNTIEYELAMEWWLLQSRFDLSWKTMYKQQGEELKRLMASFKSH